MSETALVIAFSLIMLVGLVMLIGVGEIKHKLFKGPSWLIDFVDRRYLSR